LISDKDAHHSNTLVQRTSLKPDLAVTVQTTDFSGADVKSGYCAADSTTSSQYAAPTVTEVFVIKRTVLGLVRYASLEKSPLLGSAALDEVLTQMIFSVLQKSKGKRQ